MSKVIELNSHRKMTPMYELMIYRGVDGNPYGSVVWADTDWIESTAETIAGRFESMADDMKQVAESLRLQAAEFKSEGS